MTEPEHDPWPLTPLGPPDEASGPAGSPEPRRFGAQPPTALPSDPLRHALSLLASGAAGGTLVAFAFGSLLLPTCVETRGATRGLQVDRARQQRCLELGITPAELAALEQADAEAPAAPPAQPHSQAE
jgi:hypothetical protein